MPDEHSFEMLVVNGENKMEREIDWVKSMKGEKALVLNHFFNESGEGEPQQAEEVVDLNYERVSFY